MKNPFFRLALHRATRWAGKRARLLTLGVQFAQHLWRLDKRQWKASHWRPQLEAIGRLVVAFGKGRYRDISATALVPMVAAAIYFLNPLDLIPDAIPGLGLTDDWAILMWVYRSLQSEVEKFKTWELGSSTKQPTPTH